MPSRATTPRRARTSIAAVRAVSVLAAVVVAVSSAAFTVLVADSIPFGDQNVTSGEWVMVVLGAGCALAVVGVAWLIAVIAAWRNRHLRTRYLAAPAVLLAIGVLTVAAVSVVTPDDFDGSRSALDGVVAQARSHPPGWSEHYGHRVPRQVGKVEVSSVLHRADGVVLVSDADSGVFFQMSGWAHSPEGPPTFETGVKELEISHLDGPWYSYRYVL